MKPRGISMLPLIKQDRDSVTLVKAELPLKKHELAFYRRDNGQFVLHRVMKLEKDGGYVMCGDNQTVLEYGINDSNVIAVVSEIYRGEKRLNTRSLTHKLYLVFWCCMPLRKLLRFSKRCISKIVRVAKKIFGKHID